MYPTDAILKFGFPLGVFSGARFRASVLFPVIMMAWAWRSGSLQFGMLATGVLFFSVLLHELAHLVVARSTGGELDRVELWPLGGLAEPFGRGYWKNHILTMLAGPLANGFLAATCLLQLSSENATELLNPLVGVPIVIGEPFPMTVCRLVFVINIALMVINFIPVTPLDAGVLLRTYLTERFSEVESRDVMVRLGLVVGTLGLLSGFVFDSSTIVAVSAFLTIFHFYESQRWLEAVSQSEPFEYEYDFEEREESPKWDANGEEHSPPPDSETTPEAYSEILERWRRQREQETIQLEREERQREDSLVDELLQKVHIHGRESLNSKELHLLNRMADRYKNRRQQHHS